jgi:hypothetical protein
MAGSGPSTADRELAKQASRLAGIEVTDRQIERWRQAGYLRPVVRGRGRGRGVIAVYPSEAAEHAADLARGLQVFGRLSDAALVTFLHGHEIREGALKRDYREVFARTRRFLRAEGDFDPAEVADRMSRVLSRKSSESEQGRRWRARLREQGSDDQLANVVFDFVRFFIGDADEDEALSHDAFVATGLAADVARLTPQEEGTLHANIQRLNLPQVEEAVEGASLEQLEAARDQLQTLWTLLGSESPEPNAEWTLAALGIPAVLVLGSFQGTAFAAGIAKLSAG